MHAEVNSDASMCKSLKATQCARTSNADACMVHSAYREHADCSTCLVFMVLELSLPCCGRLWRRQSPSSTSRSAALRMRLRHTARTLCEQIRNEQLTAVMTKLEGESGYLCSQNDTMVKKQEKLQAGLMPCSRDCHLSCTCSHCMWLRIQSPPCKTLV